MRWRDYLPWSKKKKADSGAVEPEVVEATPEGTPDTSEASVDTSATPEGTEETPSSTGLLNIRWNAGLANILMGSPLYSEVYDQFGGDPDQIRAGLSSVLGGETLNKLLQEAKNVKAYFDESIPDRENLVPFISTTIVNDAYPKIDPVQQASYPIREFRGDLEYVIKIMQGKPEYKDLLARGRGFACVREVAVAMVQIMQTVGGYIDQQLTAKLDELKAYVSGKHEDIADVVIRIQAAKSSDAEEQEEARKSAENLPKIPGYLAALANPATDNFVQLKDALGQVSGCSAQIRRLNEDVYKALADAINLVDDSIRLQKLRRYLQWYDASQMPPLNDIDIAYLSILSVGGGTSISIGQAIEDARKRDEQEKQLEKQGGALRILKNSYDHLHNKKYVPLAAIFQNLVDRLYSTLGIHQSELGPAANEPISKILGKLASFKDQLRKGKSELEVPLDVQGISDNLEQALSGIADALKTRYTDINAAYPVDATGVADDAADWCSFVLDYALEEIKNDREYLGAGDRVVLNQLKNGGTAVNQASAAQVLEKLESTRETEGETTEGETEQEHIARTGRIMHGGRLLDEDARRAHQAYAISRARAEIYLRNLEFHLSGIFTGIKLYEGSNDEVSLRRAGVRTNPDDIANEYIRERIKAVTETLSEEGLVEKLRHVNEQLGDLKAARAELVKESIAEREGGIRDDERKKTLAEVKDQRSLVRRAARYVWGGIAKRRYVSNTVASALDYVGLGYVIDSIVLSWYSMIGRRLTSSLDEQAYRLVQQRDDRISVARERLDHVEMDLTLGDMGATPGQLRAVKAHFRRQRKLADRAYTRRLRLLYQRAG